MANLKITDLTEDTTPASNDYIETSDSSAGPASKKVSLLNLFNNAPTGSIDPGQWTNPYCFKAYDSVGTSLTDNAEIQIDLATEVYDYNNNFASDTYTAPVNGVYHFSGLITVGTVSSGVDFAAELSKNGSLAMRGPRYALISNASAGVYGELLLTAGDTVALYGYQNSAGAETTTTGQENTFFSGYLIRAT